MSFINTMGELAAGSQAQVNYQCHIIYLDADETRSEIPASLLSRVAPEAVAYKWMIMTGLFDPDNHYGRMGDVYIKTELYGEEIYIKGEDNRWHVWHKQVDYGIKKWANSPDKFKHSYHPWLRGRLLQFDGTTLGWHPRRQYFHHRTAWNAGPHHTILGAPVYDSLDVASIARYMIAPAVSNVHDAYNSTMGADVSSRMPGSAVLVHHQLQKRERSHAHIDSADHMSKRPRRTNTPSGSLPQVMPVPTPAVASATTNPPPPPLTSTRTPLPQATSEFVACARPNPAIDPSSQHAQSQKPSASNVSPPISAPIGLVTPAAVSKAADPQAATHPKPTQSQKSSASNVPTPILASSGLAPAALEAVGPQGTTQTSRPTQSQTYSTVSNVPTPLLASSGLAPTALGAVRPQATTQTKPMQGTSVPNVSTPVLASSRLPPAASETVGSQATTQPKPSTQSQTSSTVSNVSNPIPAPSGLIPAASEPVAQATAQTKPAQSQKPSASNVSTPIPAPSGLVPATSEAVGPQTATQIVQSFLGSLSISLAHHAALLASLGIVEVSYMESLACMQKRTLEQFFATLRERGFTFMEALVLRSGLNTLRAAAHPKREAPRTSPDTIEVFLRRLSPSLACHARIFSELDIDVAHLPVFAKLDADSYAEFEKELSERGVSWVGMFLIKAGLQTFAEEPLLATG